MQKLVPHICPWLKMTQAVDKIDKLKAKQKGRALSRSSVHPLTIWTDVDNENQSVPVFDSL